MINHRGIFLSLILLLSLMPQIDAQGDSPGDCGIEQMTHNLADSLRIHKVKFGFGSSGCTVHDADAGAKIHFECTEQSSGTPPAAPQNTFVYAYNDNVQFGNPGAATPLWTFNIANCGSPASPTTFDKYCTSDGNSGSAKYFGGVRIVIRAQRTTVPTYDIDSDNGGTPQSLATINVDNNAVIRCNPHVTVLDDGNPTSSPTKYKGGDTFRSKLTVNSTYGANQPANPVSVRLVCDAFVATGTPQFTPSTTVHNHDFVIKGRAEYPNGCTLKQRYVITTFFTTTGFTTTPNFIWSTTDLLTGQTVPSDTVTERNTKVLDRTLTKTATCTFKLGAQNIIVINRNQNLDTGECAWHDSRDVKVPNNALGTAWINRATQSVSDTTDYLSTNALFNNFGDLATTHLTKTTATISSNKLYRKYVEEYGASRTDAELYNWGTTCTSAPCDFDVSATYNDDNIVTSIDSDADPLTRTFISGQDVMYWYVDKLKDANNNPISGVAISCERKLPDDTSDTIEAMGNTDANGDTTIHNLPAIPPVGVWSLTCTASSGGNTYSHEISVTYISPFSGDVDWGITIHTIDLNDTYLILNITANPKIFDVELDKPIDLFPDGDAKTSVYTWDPIDNRYEPIYEREVLIRSNQELLHITFIIEKETVKEKFQKPILVYVFGNLSLKPVMNSQYYNYFDKEGFKAEIEMNPYLLGGLIILVGLAIAFLPSRTKNPLLNIIGLIVSIMGITFATVNIDEGPFDTVELNYTLIYFLFAAVLFYLAFKTFDESTHNTEG